MKILFLEFTCNIPYNSLSLQESSPIAGTERTLITIAEELSRTHEVFVGQQARKDDGKPLTAVNYVSLATIENLSDNFDAVIVVRALDKLEYYAKKFTRAKKFLWMHDLPTVKIRKQAHLLAKYNFSVICVSHFQKAAAQQIFANQNYHDYFVIYNPVSNNLHPDNTAVIHNKLVFFSSPDRGITEIILRFNELLKQQPDFRLYIANPGYISLGNYKKLDRTLLFNEQIVILGRLSHQSVIRHVREAFCVFYPQHYKRESFGLIYAEANAVGTPVLAHNFGAAEEVLSNSEQLVDVTKPEAAIKKLLHWRLHGRPSVYGKEIFRLDNVMHQWHDLLSKTD